MKLSEALNIHRPLFESFRDLRTMIEAADMSLVDVPDGFTRTLNQIQAMDSSAPDVRGASDVAKLARWVYQHRLINEDVSGLIGTYRRDYRSRGLSREDWVGGVLNDLTQKMRKIITVSNEPERQSPDIDRVVERRGYGIYRLNNYMAARTVCNRFGLNVCIGADPSQFDSYGSSRGRETYAIVINDSRVVTVNSGSDGFLITSHSNASDVTEEGDNRGSGMTEVIEDFTSNGLTIGDVIEALVLVVGDRYSQVITSLVNDSLLKTRYSNIHLFSDYGYKAETKFRDGLLGVSISSGDTPPIELYENGGDVVAIIMGSPTKLPDPSVVSLLNTMGLSDEVLIGVMQAASDIPPLHDLSNKMLSLLSLYNAINTTYMSIAR